MSRREVKVDFWMGLCPRFLLHFVRTQIVQNDMELLAGPSLGRHFKDPRCGCARRLGGLVAEFTP